MRERFSIHAHVRATGDIAYAFESLQLAISHGIARAVRGTPALALKTELPSFQIEFEWYLSSADVTSAASSVNMVCNGGWDEAAILPFTPSVNKTCPSSDPKSPGYYLGPSKVGTCNSLTDTTCVSKGPDMVAGAVHVLTERLLKLQFTGVYYSVAQSVVTRLDDSFDVVNSILNVFRCFEAGWRSPCPEENQPMIQKPQAHARRPRNHHRAIALFASSTQAQTPRPSALGPPLIRLAVVVVFYTALLPQSPNH